MKCDGRTYSFDLGISSYEEVFKSLPISRTNWTCEYIFAPTVAGQDCVQVQVLRYLLPFSDRQIGLLLSNADQA